jgi:hypothetical protein
MKLPGQTVALLLSEDGQQILRLSSVSFPASGLVTVLIEESEDLGLWIRIPREDQVHLLLLRWEYILTIDLPSGVGRVVGIRGK